MRYEVMGPLRIINSGTEFRVQANKVQVLLATLLVRTDQIVSVDQLKEEIWGQCLPRRAAAGIHVYVSQVRKFLERVDGTECRVLTRPPGYTLHIGADDLDLHEFERTVSEARIHRRARRYKLAIERLDHALSLCRGPLLGDIYKDIYHGSILGTTQAWLDETRMECMELLIDARLKGGHHRELVGSLYQLTREHPLREALHGQLMLALYRCGRRAEALDVYQSARRVLNEELGLEPSRDLQNLQQFILGADQKNDRVGALR
jgi:SARP family transcriptional regulator, regulator of embCAB operon